MSTKSKYFIIMMCIFVAIISSANGEARFRVHNDYEDSIRIVLIWNDANGESSCDPETQPIGLKTLEFVKKALNIGKVPNVKDLKNTRDNHTTWNDIIALWGNDTLPHCIVHINAGWSTGWNGPELNTIFTNAISRKIGIVSIGDDAANLAANTFGFEGVKNGSDVLDDGKNFDSLWIGLLRDNDNLLKTRNNNNLLVYPSLNGIISNAIDSILKDSTLHFFPVGQGRCQADADEYTIRYPEWITMLGYQQGFTEIKGAVPKANELNVLVAIQDTTDVNIIRRGVALSFQPGFLQNIAASEQIVYDAIMFGSLTHTLSVANQLNIKVSSASLVAGESIKLDAEIFDQKGKSLAHLLPMVQWKIINPDKADKLTPATGATTNLSGTKAWRTVTVEASVIDPETNKLIKTTADIKVIPGPPHHLDLQNSQTVLPGMLNEDTPAITLNLSSKTTSDTLYAVLRDQFNNYISKSDTVSTNWLSENTNIATAKGIARDLSSGTVTIAGQGKTTVTVSQGTLIPDKATIDAQSVVIRSTVMLDTNGNGLIDRIMLTFDVPVSIKLPAQVTADHNGNKLFSSNIVTRKPLDSIVYIDLKEDGSRGLQTDWTFTLNGIIPFTIRDATTPIDISSTTVLDGAGPVILKAVLHTALQNIGDTLNVTVSEPVNKELLSKVSPEDAFNYFLYTSESTPNPEILKGSRFIFTDNNEYITSFSIILDKQYSGPFELTPYKDKLQFFSGSKDKSGNSPPPAEISRKEIIQESGVNVIQVSIFPNPMTMNSVQTIHPTIRNRFSEIIGGKTDGILIGIISKKNLSYATAIIYDAVGNIMVKGIELKKSTGKQEYGYFWGGLNKNGRRVGSGTYLLIVKMVDNEGILHERKLKLGVKW